MPQSNVDYVAAMPTPESDFAIALVPIPGKPPQFAASILAAIQIMNAIQDFDV